MSARAGSSAYHDKLSPRFCRRDGAAVPNTILPPHYASGTTDVARRMFTAADRRYHLGLAAIQEKLHAADIDSAGLAARRRLLSEEDVPAHYHDKAAFGITRHASRCRRQIRRRR